jgi:hypothetical protein
LLNGKGFRGQAPGFSEVDECFAFYFYLPASLYCSSPAFGLTMLVDAFLIFNLISFELPAPIKN